MPSIDLNDLATFGSVRDVASHMLPPEAWGLAINMRSENRELRRMSGWAQIFGTPGVAPHFAIPVDTAAAHFWLYSSLAKIYGYDGSSHTNVTRQTASVDVDYTATETRDINGCLLGGIPIINNGADVPQYWTAISLASKMAAIPNWPATTRCKIMRSFGPFLIALNINDNGTVKPHLVRWSHPTDPGSLPASWDPSDPTRDTGQQDLSDTAAGIIRDGLHLGSYFYVYKDQSTWRFRFVGGAKIFDFGEGPWLPTSGILAPRCVTLAKKGMAHVVATQDDILWHNGNNVESILDQRWKRTLFSTIDSANYVNSFMFDNAPKNEVWFCYPSQGQTHPDRALIMNYSDQMWVITEADGINFRNAIVGAVESPDPTTWADGDNSWDEEEGAWEEIDRRSLVACSTSNTKFWALDRTSSRDGSTFTATIQRQGLSLVGRKRDGSWIVDHQVLKLFLRVWPKISGGPIEIRFGSQQLIEGPITWGDYYEFDPNTGEVEIPLGMTADMLPTSGRACGVEFRTTGIVDWTIKGYKIEFEMMGNF